MILYRVISIPPIHDGSFHVFVERKPGPEQDRRVVDVIYIPCTGYKGITKFLGIVVRKQFFSAVSIDIKNLIIYNYEKACEKDFARFFHGEGKWKEKVIP